MHDYSVPHSITIVPRTINAVRPLGAATVRVCVLGLREQLPNLAFCSHRPTIPSALRISTQAVVGSPPRSTSRLTGTCNWLDLLLVELGVHR